jgi:3',5'-cyclic AMP phosphodiesterase CpdA
MRPICWLHISDIHMRVNSAWSLDVVLRAMCDDIAGQRKQGIAPDFILATGDLAFSGQAEEYKLVASFFDAVSGASGVPRDRIFCVPGNHDIDRGRQNMCFRGARNFAQSQNQIDDLLSPGDDLETLLKRQEDFRKFQNSYLTGQARDWTADGLGYVSSITVEDVLLAIVGLDSAWLAEGGVDDHGKLLIGERQVINALELAGRRDPHIIISMAHHPFHLLQNFDRHSVQMRVERSCHFFHCGHLHEPEARKTAGPSGPGCLTLAAGASFETRQTHNSYSMITLDLLGAKRTVKTIQYRPASGAFAFTSVEEYPIDITPSGMCSVGELARAMSDYRQSLSPLSHYLSALLLDQKGDLLIQDKDGYAFGSYAVLLAQPDSELKRKTMEFMPFKNVLRVYYKRLGLASIFTRHGDAVGEYGAALENAYKAHGDLKIRLADLEKDARALASTDPQTSFSHTTALLDEIAAEQDWPLLRDQAGRHVDSTEPILALKAIRMLALGLSHSAEAMDRDRAISLYQSVVTEESSEPADIAFLATLLSSAGKHDEAKRAVLTGIERFPGKGAAFSEIGLRIVESTGDREFRKQIDTAVEAREK